MNYYLLTFMKERKKDVSLILNLINNSINLEVLFVKS